MALPRVRTCQQEQIRVAGDRDAEVGADTVLLPGVGQVDAVLLQDDEVLASGLAKLDPHTKPGDPGPDNRNLGLPHASGDYP